MFVEIPPLSTDMWWLNDWRWWLAMSLTTPPAQSRTDAITMSDALTTEYLTPQEFARRSGLSLATVRRRIRDKSLPVLQSGGPRTAIRIPATALLASHQPPKSSAAPASSPDDAPPKRGIRPRPQWMKGSR